MKRRAMIALGVVAAGVAGLGGFHEWVADQLVQAPNRGRAPVEPAAPDGVDHALRVPVGPPAAELSVWIVDPDDAPPRATVIVLHGIYDSRVAMVGAAERLAAQGMRAVLPDLRGHGASSGDTLTFGVVEGRDVVQVVDALEAEGRLAGPLAVYGASYGGAIAHQVAGADPRVRAVVSVAGFADLPGLMPEYAEMSWPLFAWAIPDAALRSMASRAASLGGFTLEQADAARATRRSEAATLIIHGDRDEVVGYAHARRLYEACRPRGCELSRRRGLDHVSVMGNPEIQRDIDAFLRRELLGEPPAAQPGP